MLKIILNPSRSNREIFLRLQILVAKSFVKTVIIKRRASLRLFYNDDPLISVRRRINFTWQ